MHSDRQRYMTSCRDYPSVPYEKSSVVHRRAFIEDRLQDGIRNAGIELDDILLSKEFIESCCPLDEDQRTGIILRHLLTSRSDLMDQRCSCRIIILRRARDDVLERTESLEPHRLKSTAKLRLEYYDEQECQDIQ